MKTIKQIVVIKASPEQVYDALMESKKHVAFTHDKAKISKKVDGKFSAYGRYITGKNLELIRGKKIYQSWHASDWPEGWNSKVTFIFDKIKEGTKDSTRLTFTHEGVPSEYYESIKKGWIDFYWDPLKEYLEK